jgi:hypothetical protein
MFFLLSSYKVLKVLLTICNISPRNSNRYISSVNFGGKTEAFYRISYKIIHNQSWITDTATRAYFWQYSLVFVDKFILKTILKLTFFVLALVGGGRTKSIKCLFEACLQEKFNHGTSGFFSR